MLAIATPQTSLPAETSAATIANDGGRAILDRLLAFQVRGHALGGALTAEVFRNVGETMRKARRTVVCVRGYCPYPAEYERRGQLLPFPSPSSLDRSERNEAVRLLTLGVEWAARIEARALMIPCGHAGAQFPHAELDKLRKKREWPVSPGAQALRARFAEKRKGAAPRHVDALQSALDPLLETAEKYQVRLAIENRADPAELPARADLEQLLGTFRGSGLGCWFNLANAAVQERLGFESQAEILALMRSQFIGCTIDDWSGEADGLPPGEGGADYETLRRFADQDLPLLLDRCASVEKQRIEQALAHLRGLGLDGSAPPPPCEPFPILGRR